MIQRVVFQDRASLLSVLRRLVESCALESEVACSLVRGKLT